MIWLDLITMLALIQLFAFSGLVGRARGMYGIKAPATTGHEMFERYHRVHMNTIEVLMLFLPSLWIAARYWDAGWIAAVGVFYLVGRMIYLKSYVKDPATRSLGFALSIFPVGVYWLAILAGLAKGLLGST
jgi:uncharacterized MAPEG superfamily protein